MSFRAFAAFSFFSGGALCSGTAVVNGEVMMKPIHGLFEAIARWRTRRIAARRIREMFSR